MRRKFDADFDVDMTPEPATFFGGDFAGLAALFLGEGRLGLGLRTLDSVNVESAEFPRMWNGLGRGGGGSIAPDVSMYSSSSDR